MWKHYVLGLAISLAALYFFFSTVSLAEVGLALGRMNPWWLVPSVLVLAGTFWLRAWRWHFLMRPVKRLGLGPLMSAMMVGFLANNILPAHMGEVVRAVVLGRQRRVSVSATMATIVMERVCDGLSVLLMLLLVLLFIEPPAAAGGGAITLEGLRIAGWAGLALFAGVLVVLQAFRRWRAASLRALAWCLKPLPERLSAKVLGLADAFIDGLAVARAADMLWVVLLSLAIWAAYGLWAWTLLPAFDLALGFWAGALVEVVLALALVIPAAPGFVGTFHVAASASLIFLGVDATVAASYALVLWLLHFVYTCGTGLYYFWRLGLGWRDITTQRREP